MIGVDGSNIHALFPKPIGVYNIGRPLSDSELDFIVGYERQRNQTNAISASRYILNEPELADIRKICSIKLNEYFLEVVNPEYDIALSITQSWINYAERGEPHHSHNHPNSYVSAVMFIQGGGTSDCIQFTDNLYGTKASFGVRPASHNIWNAREWSVGMEPGDIVFFPADLLHHVPKVDHDGERISLSFNSFFTGDLGDPFYCTRANVKTDGYLYKEDV